MLTRAEATLVVKRWVMFFVAVVQTALAHARNGIAIYSSCGNLEKLPVRPTRDVHDRKPKKPMPAMLYQANAYYTSGSAPPARLKPRHPGVLTPQGAPVLSVPECSMARAPPPDDGPFRPKSTRS